ncbi:MAG: TIGR03086 family metal-binding protein [Ilumatobacteraceae bacterium]
MNDGSIAERYRRVGGRFTETVANVPADAWDAPAPCEGWVARDVVRHLVEWFPPFLESGSGISIPPIPSVELDPVQAWMVLDQAVQGLLDDPATTSTVFSHTLAGTHQLDQAIGQFFLGDVLLHTWDLARAAGLDERLDPAEVAAMLAGILPMDEALRQSGQFGPRVEVADDADEQTRLIAFVGRRP